MTTNVPTAQPGPVGQAMLDLITYQIGGEHRKASAQLHTLAQQRDLAVVRCMRDKGIPRDEATFLVMQSALAQVVQYSPNADVVSRAATMKNRLALSRHPRPDLHKGTRQASLRAVAARRKAARQTASADR